MWGLVNVKVSSQLFLICHLKTKENVKYPLKLYFFYKNSFMRALRIKIDKNENNLRIILSLGKLNSKGLSLKNVMKAKKKKKP